MDEIVFLCTGNTCRSPMAEALFRLHGGEQKTGLRAASAGLYTQDGLPATENACKAAAEQGAELSAHRARLLTPEIARGAKYLVCMTLAQYDALCERFPDCADKIFTLLPTDISDPFGGDLDAYRRAAKQIDEGVQSVVKRLTQ